MNETYIKEDTKQVEIPEEKPAVNRGKILTEAAFILPYTYLNNPWSPSEIDKMDLEKKQKPEDEYHDLIKACRFFYKKDPIASSTLNKLVEIGIGGLTFTKGKLSDNEIKIFEYLKENLQEFAEAMALEYLISGLVIPEINYAVVPKEQYKTFGVKKYDSLILPVTMWLRDPATVKINSVYMAEPSYYVKIPENLIYFIKNDGKYPDGTEDKALFEKLQHLYPDFVTAVKTKDVKEILLNNDLIFRRKVLSDSPYPVPYLLPAIEPLKHKRNLRRMDYSVAARVIGAIQLIKLGSDEFPVTIDDKDSFEAVKQQMYYRYSGGKDIESVFQLFANHTLNIEWIVPPTEALLDDTKYSNVNQDIIFALGFPRILITGEAERTGTSSPEYATMSPSKTMENFRRKILKVLRRVVNDVANLNKIVTPPELNLEPLRLNEFQTWSDALIKLYESGNISRHTLVDEFGYNWDDEAEERSKENEDMKKLKIGEFAPQPFSPQPGNEQGGNPAASKPKPAPKNPTNSQ